MSALPMYSQLQIPRATASGSSAYAPALASVDDPSWLVNEANWLNDIDKASTGVRNSIDAIRTQPSYQKLFPDDWPLKEIEKLFNAVSAHKLTDDANRLRSIGGRLTQLEQQLAVLQQQNTMLQQQIAQQAALAQRPQAPQVPIVQATTTAPQGPGWGTMLATVGIIAVLGLGAYYVMTHRRQNNAEER